MDDGQLWLLCHVVRALQNNYIFWAEVPHLMAIHVLCCLYCAASTTGLSHLTLKKQINLWCNKTKRLGFTEPCRWCRQWTQSFHREIQLKYISSVRQFGGDSKYCFSTCNVHIHQSSALQPFLLRCILKDILTNSCTLFTDTSPCPAPSCTHACKYPGLNEQVP